MDVSFKEVIDSEITKLKRSASVIQKPKTVDEILKENQNFKVKLSLANRRELNMQKQLDHQANRHEIVL